MFTALFLGADNSAVYLYKVNSVQRDPAANWKWIYTQWTAENSLYIYDTLFQARGHIAYKQFSSLKLDIF